MNRSPQKHLPIVAKKANSGKHLASAFAVRSMDKTIF